MIVAQHSSYPTTSITLVPVSQIRRSIASCKMDSEIPPNAMRRKIDPNWRGGFSLGVDLGMSRTGLAISKGYSIRPLTVLELRGQKLELRLLDIAEKQEVDEFIVGLPRSSDGLETPQSNKVRSVAGRLAVQAAERVYLLEKIPILCHFFFTPISDPDDRGWRVYLQDEYGSSTMAMDYMIDKGLGKSARQGKVDAYAAVVLLERYFSLTGEGVELVLPKLLTLQNKLREGPMDLF
ncbi:RNA processing factor [Lithospermum erythrorhizon]|uniref:RNA processing factor n=1 Tax=Lithospermum erythrorhizon TaxID=34254 RepID=A0AAV3QRA4_LITER